MDAARSSRMMFINCPLPIIGFARRGTSVARFRRPRCCSRRNLPSPSHLVGCAENPVNENQVPLLEMRNISYQVPMNFDIHLFTNMNFKVYAGEFILVIGENGAGKSTALDLMTGFRTVDRGKGDLYWKGKKVKPSSMIDHVGVVLQDPAKFFITRTVLDELILGRKTKTPNDVRRVLAAVGLRDISLKARPKSLSGGQVRRLAVASQLMREPLPELFLLDEPLAGVDWTARRDLVALLASLKSQFSIVIISHEPGELLEYADRVVEVSRGGIHDIDHNIIRKAIKVRALRTAERRAKALEDAAEYLKQKHATEHVESRSFPEESL